MSDNDWISVIFHRLNSKASKAMSLETSFTTETSDAAIQNSFKNNCSTRFTYYTIAIIKLFTATVILQFY